MLFQISSLQMGTLLNHFKGLRERSPQKTENLKTQETWKPKKPENPKNLKIWNNQNSKTEKPERVPSCKTETKVKQLCVGCVKLSSSVKYQKYLEEMASARPKPTKELFEVLGQWKERLQAENGMFKVIAQPDLSDIWISISIPR